MYVHNLDRHRTVGPAGGRQSEWAGRVENQPGAGAEAAASPAVKVYYILCYIHDIIFYDIIYEPGAGEGAGRRS